MKPKLHLVLAIVVSALLCSCGGADVSPPAQSAADAVAALRTELHVLAATASPASATEQLFDFAEAAYPSYFPGHKVTASSSPFAYRYYPETGVYLGLVVNHGATEALDSVYVMGGPFGNTPALVGPMTDYLVRIKGSIEGMPSSTGYSDLVLSLAFEPPAGGALTSETVRITFGSAFEFATLVPVGTRYRVVVQSSPSKFVDGGESIDIVTCSVSGGEGVASSSSPTPISITCGVRYSLAGTISWVSPPAEPGLTFGPVLASGGLTATPPLGATSFILSSAVVAGTPYSVAVQRQPTGYTCAVANGSGIVFSDVSAVKVSCVANADLSIPASAADGGYTTTTNGFTLNLILKDLSVPKFTVNQIRDTFLAAYPKMWRGSTAMHQGTSHS